MTDMKTLKSPSGREVQLPDRLAAYELARDIGWSEVKPTPAKGAKGATTPTTED